MNATAAKILVALLIVGRPPLGAQRWRPGAWAGVAWDTRTVLRGITDRELFMTSIEFTRPVLTSPHFSVRYVVAVTPLAVVASPVTQASTRPDCIRVCYGGLGLWSGWEKRYGAGLAPLGLQLEARFARSVGVIAEGQTGALWFTRDVPVESAGRFAFVAGLSVGAVVTVPFLGRMRGGYRLLHLSNAGLAAQNPGLNANLWFLGWSP
jgi:lipid A 3-O-deacylase PagL